LKHALHDGGLKLSEELHLAEYLLGLGSRVKRLSALSSVSPAGSFNGLHHSFSADLPLLLNLLLNYFRVEVLETVWVDVEPVVKGVDKLNEIVDLLRLLLFVGQSDLDHLSLDFVGPLRVQLQVDYVLLRVHDQMRRFQRPVARHLGQVSGILVEVREQGQALSPQVWHGRPKLRGAGVVLLFKLVLGVLKGLHVAFKAGLGLLILPIDELNLGLEGT